MCTECNNNKLTIIELQSQLKQSQSECNELMLTNAELCEKINELEKAIVNLVKMTIL